MKKKILALLISALMLPQITMAQINVYQGGTGQTSFTAGEIVIGGTAFSLTSTTTLTVESITATSTTATSTFPNVSFTTAVDFLGDYVTNGATWIRSKISETIAGISYDSATGVFSLSADYEIPLTASTTHWEDAYGWGDHGIVGYLTSLTPWTSDIDGGAHKLTNVDSITATGTNATSSFTAINVGTTTSAYAVNVQGAIQTDTAFYGDNWISASGNSMVIQPTGDTDDFFSFKTPSDRPTIKREGGKYIYIESSNVNDVGISFRKDADHSGTVNYYKDTEEFGLTSKDPLVFKVCGDYDDYLKICSANNIPELSVASSSGFKINAGGANALLLNHDGGNVGIGDTTPGHSLSLQTGDASNNVIFSINNTTGTEKGYCGVIGTASHFVSGGIIGDTFLRAQQDLHLLAGTNGIDQMILKSGGNVGIGTTDPDTPLHVYDASATTTLYIESGGAGLGGRIIMEDSDGAGCSQLTVLNGVISSEVIACP